VKYEEILIMIDDRNEFLETSGVLQSSQSCTLADMMKICSGDQFIFDQYQSQFRARQTSGIPPEVSKSMPCKRYTSGLGIYFSHELFAIWINLVGLIWPDFDW
jgi:hypothetical protein